MSVAGILASPHNVETSNWRASEDYAVWAALEMNQFRICAVWIMTTAFCRFWVKKYGKREWQDRNKELENHSALGKNKPAAGFAVSGINWKLTNFFLECVHCMAALSIVIYFPEWIFNWLFMRIYAIKPFTTGACENN